MKEIFGKVVNVDLFGLPQKPQRQNTHCGSFVTILWVSGFIAFAIFTITQFQPFTPIITQSTTDTSLATILALDPTAFTIIIRNYNNASDDEHNYFSEVNAYFPLWDILTGTYVQTYSFVPDESSTYFNGTQAYILNETVTINGTNLEQQNGIQYALEIDTLNCSHQFELELFFSRVNVIDPDTGEIFNDTFDTGDGIYYYFDLGLDPSQYAYYNMELRLQNITRKPSLFSGSQNSIGYIPTLYPVYTIPSKNCIPGESSMMFMNFYIASKTDSISIAYQEFTSVISTLGGMWSSIFGVLSVIFSLYLKYLKGKICLRKKKVSPEKSTSNALKDIQEPAIPMNLTVEDKKNEAQESDIAPKDNREDESPDIFKNEAQEYDIAPKDSREDESPDIFKNEVQEYDIAPKDNREDEIPDIFKNEVQEYDIAPIDNREDESP